MKARNINDDNTLAYLFNKTRNAASSALEKAVEAINNTITTITTNMPQWINANISYVSGETIDDKIARLLSGDYLPRNKPFIGCVISGSKYFTAGYLYVASNQLYGSFIFSSYKGTNTSGGIYSVTADVVEKRSADMSEVVMKAGDTMTGGLSINVAGTPTLHTKNTNADTSLATDTAARYWSTYHKDKNDKLIAYWESAFATNGSATTSFRARRQVSGANSDNGVSFTIAANGTKSVALSAPAAWRTALGLGGMATVASPAPIANGGTGLTASPSMLTNLGSTTAADILTASPRPGITGTLAVGHGGTGRATITANAVLAGNTTSAVKMITTASGALFATAANGAASFGTLPIAQGGTGQTAVTGTTTVSQILTAASGVTIVGAKYAQWGKVASLWVDAKINTAITVGTGKTIATLVSGKRPYHETGGVWLYAGTASVTIGTNGGILVRAAMNANVEFWFQATYLLA